MWWKVAGAAAAGAAWIHRSADPPRGGGESVGTIGGRRDPGEFGEAAGKAVPVVVGREDTFAAVAPVDDRVPVVGHPNAKRSSHARFLPVRWLLSMLRM